MKRRRQWLKPGQRPKDNSEIPEKRMLSIWWGVIGVIYWELLPEKTIVNNTRYRAQLNKLDSKVVEQGLSLFNGTSRGGTAAPPTIFARPCTFLKSFLTQSPRNYTPKAFTIYQDVGQRPRKLTGNTYLINDTLFFNK